MKLSGKVIIMCKGPMTAEQREKVEAYSSIRTDKLIMAAKWLCENNVQWQHINFE